LGAIGWAAIPADDVRADEIPLGPLFHNFRLTLEPGERTEALGPLYYQENSDETHLWAAPPIFSYLRNDEVDFERFDFAWKGITYSRFGDEYRFQILQLFSFAGAGTQSETNVSRFSLFPIYFQQRSPIPEKNYTAVLPIYGTIKQRFFRDEIHFLMFPLYGQSRKRDVVTDNYLFPVFHLRHGDGLEGWQFWPLYGTETKSVTTKTNAWGDTETAAGHRKNFVLWPLFFDQHLGLGTPAESRQVASIPFYSRLRSPLRDSTSYLFPIGLTITDDREKKYHEVGAPWPLIVFAHGEGKTCRRVFPFFSQAHNASHTSDWYLWPVYKYNRLDAPPLLRERTRLALFLYSDTRARHGETGQTMRQIDLWPLFTSRREYDGRRRVQCLSLIEPILPNNSGVERNLSPLWSIWRAESNPATGARSQSFLWNLYRRDATPDSKKCSLLFGLFQYHSGPDGRRWRLFYVPFGKNKTAEKPETR
jgi:hypothetical protein